MNKNKIRYLLVGLIFILLIIAFLLLIPNNSPNPPIENNTVMNIIDGDTFEYYDEISESILIVRLLCVDTPEKNEEGYEEASNYLSSLILNKQVILNSSLTNEDKYGRLLRYVYVEDSGETLFVNKLILDNYYGDLFIVPPESCEEMN